MRLEISERPVSCIAGAAAQPPVQFSLLITDKTSANPLEIRHMQLDIEQDLSHKNDASASQAFKLCAKELDDAIRTNRCFLDGFLVLHNESENVANFRKPKSLKQLLEEQKDRLDLAGKLNLGLKLGVAAIHFHSSPWINLWSKETVTVFTTSGEQQDVDSLVPHILSDLTAGDSRTRVCDLYLLGLMLLEIAGYDLKELQEIVRVGGNEVHLLNWDLLSSLSKKFGLPYQNLVRGVLEVGQRWSGKAEDGDLESLVQLVQDLRDFREKFG